MKLGTVYADAVTVPDGRRNLDPAAVDRLVESISAIGLQQPISVWAPDANTAILVAGRHRFEACKRLNWFEIPAVFVDMDERERRMWEISENLHRAELTTLERDEQVAEWIRLASRNLRKVRKFWVVEAKRVASAKLHGKSVSTVIMLDALRRSPACPKKPRKLHASTV